jgi:hypothetical protein
MPYSTGSWGEQAKARNIRRRKYFRERSRLLNGVKNTISFESEQEALARLHIPNKLFRFEVADILWKGKYIDVKTDKFSLERNGWQFDCSKQKGKIDYFMCVAKDINGKTQYIFMIPDKSFSTKYIWISPNNIYKYMKYLFRK